MISSGKLKIGSIVILNVLALLLIIACDGGGGSSNTPYLSYTGSTSKALIEESNAVDMATGSTMAGMRSSSFTGFTRSARSAGPDNQQIFGIYKVFDALKNAVVRLGEHASDISPLSRAVESEEVTIEGSCGGKLIGNFFTEDTTGEYWGEISFQNYCPAADFTMDGFITFSGKINLDSGEMESISFDVEYLSSTDGYGAFRMTGALSMIVGQSSSTANMDMYIQIGNDGNVYWINNFRIETTDIASDVSMNMTGRFYHPTFGYVDLSTPQDIVTDFSQIMPVSGELMVVGKEGSAGSATKAKLLFMDAGVFRVEADTNGDGVFNWVSDVLSWDDI